MSKKCQHFSKYYSCQMFDNYGKIGCPTNVNDKCEIVKGDTMEYDEHNASVIKARERVAKIVSSKLCLKLTDHQRKMLSDEIMHCAMLCSIDAISDMANSFARNRK